MRTISFLYQSILRLSRERSGSLSLYILLLIIFVSSLLSSQIYSSFVSHSAKKHERMNILRDLSSWSAFLEANIANYLANKKFFIDVDHDSGNYSLRGSEIWTSGDTNTLLAEIYSHDFPGNLQWIDVPSIDEVQIVGDSSLTVCGDFSSGCSLEFRINTTLSFPTSSGNNLSGIWTLPVTWSSGVILFESDTGIETAEISFTLDLNSAAFEVDFDG